MLSFGWDISTAIIGCSVLLDRELLQCSYIDLRKVDGMLEKAAEARRHIVVIKGQMINWYRAFGSTHFIEDKLGGFSGGGSSAQTVMKLAQFNAVCSYIIWSEFCTTHGPVPKSVVKYLHPSHVKSVLRKEGVQFPGRECKDPQAKKKATLEWVRAREPERFKVDLNRNDNFQPWCFDMADAYTLAFVGTKEAEDGQAVEAQSGPAGPGERLLSQG